MLVLSKKKKFFFFFNTCSEIDDNVDEENGVWETVEGNPSSWKIIIEEGDGNRQNDQISHQQQQHA